MAKMKVFGGLVHMGARGQVRTIVAATSQANAAEAVGETLNGFRGWWSETGNKDELATALDRPGQVFQASSSRGKDFRPVVLREHVFVDA
jgi:hypothetical protein